VDTGVPATKANFAGGVLKCHSANKKVEVSITGQSAHNHVCGCSKFWKPANALFSQVAVIPKGGVKVRTELPDYVERYLQGEFKLNDLMHRGESIRTVIHFDK